MKEKTEEINLSFPPLSLFFFFVATCSVVKAFGGTSRDWIDVLLTVPSALYFAWTLGFCVCFALVSKLKEQ